MRLALPAVAAVVALAGCSSGGTHLAAPSATPAPLTSAAPAPTAPVTGPTVGAAVPAGAFVAPADLGAGWASAPAAVPPCPPAFARTAIRSVGLSEARGTLTETLATGVDLTSVVPAWKQSLARCGYDVRDNQLGDVAFTARSKDGSQAVLVTGTEGVLIALHARGALAQSQDDLESWADLAFGTACVAHPDGCH